MSVSVASSKFLTLQLEQTCFTGGSIFVCSVEEEGESLDSNISSFFASDAAAFVTEVDASEGLARNVRGTFGD